MTEPWTVQCAYMSHVANTVTVEADTLEEALEKAIEAANEDPAGWKSTGHVSDTSPTSTPVARAPTRTRGGTPRCRCRTASPSAGNRRWSP